MGNCRNEQQLTQVSQIPSTFYPQVEPVMKSSAQSIRLGDVEKFRSSNTLIPNNYCLILPVKQSDELIKIECPIIASYSDQLALKIPVLGGMQTTRVDVRNAPIIDLHDTINDNQILHRLLIKEGNNEKSFTVKIYPFKSYYDVWLKSGLYQASLYRQMNNFKKDNTYLNELFIIEKGAPKSLVFIFNNYYSTLQDMIRYRRASNEPYTNDEQLYIVQQLMNKYKELAINMIVHRDIRPGKVYLAELPGSRYGVHSNQSYQFQNLQSAKKVTERELKNVNPSSLQIDIPMTVRGVATYSSRQVSAFQLKGEQFGIYDPFYNDRVGLACTFASIVTLEIDTPIINYNLVRSKNLAVFDIITKLQNLAVPFLQICRGITVSNISVGILESDKKICLNYLPQILKQSQRDRIQTATTELLFSLHQRQLLTQRLDKLMNENYRTNTPYENIAILDRLGRHYQGMGVKDNEYYNQEVNLLLQMAEEQRLKGFPTNNIVEQANQVAYEKLAGKLKNPQTSVNLKIQNAFIALSKNNIQEASKIINSALQQAGASNKIAADVQIKLIKYKGIIESFLNLQSGDAYFEKGLQLSQKRSNFLTQVEMLESESDFRYLLGQNIVKRIQKSRGILPNQQLAKQCAKCESILTQARSIKLEIPNKNPLPLSRIYQSLGDLASLRQDTQGASSYYQRSFRLMQGSQLPISQTEKIKILQKTHRHYSINSENFGEQQRIKTQLNMLQKQKQLKPEDDRKHFKRIRYLKEQLKNKITQRTNPHSSAIQEVEQAYEEDRSRYPSQQLSY